ncbi:MAG TPA: TonB-dependent receptor [Candidatus Limnocylindrales bacterium]|nr:TonB-dependent receptor [Candidatus Limnocylindrales bacterium]
MKEPVLSCLRKFNLISLAAALAFCLVIVAPNPAHAQALSGISGTVTDPSGAVVPGANVTVTNVDTGVVSRSVTTSAGVYSITDLIPGAYSVRIEKANFQAAVINAISIEVGKTSTVDVELKTGAVAETIEVQGNAISLETSQPQVGTTIENSIVQEAPVFELTAGTGRDRQIDQYLFLAPGVTGGTFSHRIDGGVDFQNEVVFNGVVAAQSETQGYQTNINPPFEMIDEFRVQSSVFSAQYGLAQGVAQYQFKSGGNTLHGDAFEIMRNDWFDAPGAVRDSAGEGPALDRENNFGFSLGGPVWIPPIYNGKNKTFFHVAADWYREKNNPDSLFTVPTPEMVQGNFSNFTTSNTSSTVQPIYVPPAWAADPSLMPAGCVPGAAPGQQWPGNIIPQSCFSATSQLLLPLIPTPNHVVGNGVNNNMIPTLTVPIKQANWGFSIDHNLTQTQKLHGSFWRDSQNAPNWDHNGFFNNELSALKTEPRLGTGIFLTYSNAITNNLVVTGGIGWMGELNNEFNTHLNTGVGVGFPAVDGSIVLPTINWGGSDPNAPVSWGVNTNGETFSINRKLGIGVDNNWLWTHGRHTTNIGWELRRTYQDDHECQNCGGGFLFSSLITGDGNPADNSITGSDFATFLLGDASSATRSFALENKLRNWYFAPYIQDDIKVTPRLTVNVGVRWDIALPFTDDTRTEGTNTVVFFNPSVPNPGAVSPATGNPLLGAASALGTCPTCVGYDRAEVSLRHFSPRLGFAYELNSRTVISGGYSLNYLDSGSYEYGVHKIAVDYGNWLAGSLNVPSFGTYVPNYGEWDTNVLPVPATTPFSPTIANVNNPHFFDRSLTTLPYVQAWNAGVQRELPGNMFVQVSYVGNRSVHIPAALIHFDQLNPSYLSLCTPANGGLNDCTLSNAWTDGVNQPILQSLGFAQTSVTCPGGGPSGNFYTPYVNFLCDWGPSAPLSQALLPYPQFSGITDNYDQTGMSLYNALQVQFQKRYASGLSFLVNYTLARNMTNTDSGFGTFNGGSLNQYNTKAEWSVADNDETHLANVSVVYELPLGPGKKFLNSGGIVAKNLLGGWQFSTFFTYQSGLPFGISANGGLPNAAGNRADRIPGVPLTVNWDNYYQDLAGNPVPVFNPAAFSAPGIWALGNTPRNVLRNPFYSNENLAFAKHFFLGDRVSAELRVEYFNLFNRFLVGNCLDENSNDSLAAGGNGNFGLEGLGSVCQGNSPRQGQAYFTVRF